MSSSKLRSRHTFIWVAIGLFVTFLQIAGCTSSDDPGNDETSSLSRTPVKVQSVRSRTLEATVEAIGTLRADRTVRVSPEIAGRIESVNFTEGAALKKGEILVQLDDDKLRQQYQARRQALNEAQANLENARRTYRRNKRLRKNDMVSEQQYDDSEAAFEAAKARVRQLRAQVKEARERLDDATIEAPYTGVIGSRDVDPGNYVRPGDVLSVLYRVKPLEVQFTVPGHLAERVQEGQSVRAHVSSLSNTVLRGEVFFVSPSVREETRDLLVKARIRNPNRVAKPGSFARIELTLKTRHNRPVVPSEALIGTTEGYILFAVKNGKAYRQSVKIGIRKPGMVEIREGIKPEQRVVVAGHQNLSDGTPVKIINEQD